MAYKEAVSLGCNIPWCNQPDGGRCCTLPHACTAERASAACMEHGNAKWGINSKWECHWSCLLQLRYSCIVPDNTLSGTIQECDSLWPGSVACCVMSGLHVLGLTPDKKS